MQEREYPKLRLPEWFDETCEYEVRLKGYFEHGSAILENGRLFKLFFIEPSRLQQSIDDRVRSGREFFAQNGMVILPEVTTERMKEALPLLEEEGFFDALVPQRDHV